MLAENARDLWAKRRRATVTGIEARLGSTTTERNEAVVLINKTEIMALLLSRGSEERAAWVDRELPGLVDSDIHSALLELLHVDVSTMSDASEQQTEHRT